jgi:hypothetical protein
MADLLGADYGLVEKNALYRCLDKLLEHKTALFDHLHQRWQDLFGIIVPAFPRRSPPRLLTAAARGGLGSAT